MKRRDGFVLIETLVVVLLLTVTLMSLYASFSYIVSKTKERNNNDSIETLYKTYYIKDLLDSYESSHINESTEDYRDSFIYYVNKLKLNTVTETNKQICTSYDYNSGKSGYSIDSSNNQMIVCDFSVFNADKNNVDPIYEAVDTYGVNKIYYLNYRKLSDSLFRTELLNQMDASSIDYVISQPDSDGYYMIIKFLKDYNYPSNYDIVSRIQISTEAFHSSIAMDEVEAGDSSAPIYFCANSDCTNYATSGTQFKNSDKVTLSSSVSFKETNGLSINGWCNSPNVFDSDFNFDSKVSLTKSGNNVDGIECYNVGDEMTVTSKNRKMYVHWCGDGTLKGTLECSAVKNDNPTSSGLYVNTNSDSKIWRYYGDVSNNYVVVGDYCFRLMSNFTPYSSSDTGFKAIYAGKLTNGSSSCDDAIGFWQTGAYSTLSGLNNAALTATNDGVNGVVRSSYELKTLVGDSYSYGSAVTYSSGKYTISKDKGTSNAYGNWSTSKRYLISNNDTSKLYYLVTKSGSALYYVVMGGGTSTESKYYNEYLNGTTKNKKSNIYSLVFDTSNSSSFAYMMENDASSRYKDYTVNKNYCNDLSVGGGLFGTSDTISYSGSSTDYINYNATQRLGDGQIKLDCSDSKYTYSSKVGLLTLDEAEYVGATTSNLYNYLKINSSTSSWLMTPASLGKIYTLDSSGRISMSSTYTGTSSIALGFRPVISINLNDNLLCGTGTSSSPYVVGNDAEKTKYCGGE